MFETVLSEPQKFGLELVADMDLRDGPYEFDIVAVWRDLETGGLYYGTDSGCSCPVPFEGLSKSDLVSLNANNFMSFRDLLLERAGNPADASEFVLRIRQEL